MRRLLAILVLLITSLPLVSSVMAATPLTGDTSLPACCRHHGAHHCLSGSGGATQVAKTVLAARQERCPMWPLAAAPANHTNTSLLVTFLFQPHSPSLEPLEYFPDVFPGDDVELSRHVRGPPSLRS